MSWMITATRRNLSRDSLPRATNNNRVVPMRRGSGMEVSLIKPTSLEDAERDLRLPAGRKGSSP